MRRGNLVIVGILFALLLVIIVAFINRSSEIINAKKVSANNSEQINTINETNVVSTENIENIQNEQLNVQTAKREKPDRPALKDGLPILMYHFFYEESDPNFANGSNDSNIMNINFFEKELQYLKENDFYYPTWEEVEDYIDGKTTLPEKSVVLTFDDGNPTFFILAAPLLDKYEIPGTSFVITSWYEESLYEGFKMVDYQSHSDNMHKGVGDGTGQGVMMYWSYEDMKKDLITSSDKIKKARGKPSTVFCYPFGHLRDDSIRAVKDAGYHLAVTVKEGRVYPGADKYKLPRVRMQAHHSMAQFEYLVD